MIGSMPVLEALRPWYTSMWRMQYVVAHAKMKKSTQNFVGFLLLYCRQGQNLDRQPTPPSSKEQLHPASKVERDAALHVLIALLHW
jgi:hypothetical protein